MNKKLRNKTIRKKRRLGRLYILMALGIASSTVFASALSSNSDVSDNKATKKYTTEVPSLERNIEEAYNQGNIGKARVGLEELVNQKKIALQEFINNSPDNIDEDELERMKLEINMLESYLKEFF